MLNLNFIAEANGQALTCDATILGLGTDDTDVTLRDFRFYIHDLSLVTDTGEDILVSLDQNQWQTDTIALVDFQNRSDNCDGEIWGNSSYCNGYLCRQ